MGTGRGAAWMVAALLVSGAVPAVAQDSHYWTNQYGTRAELLGGNVVGSIKDLSCVFYNPGAMALVETPELILTTDAFQLERIEIDGAGPGRTSLASTDAGKAPSIFAVRIDAIDPLGTRGIALSSVTRHDFRADLTAIRITPAGEPIAGIGYFSGEADFSQRLHESWYGATVARKYGKFGIGATLFGAYRSQSGRAQTLASAAGGSSQGTTLTLVEAYSYWNFRLLAKVGVAWDWTDFTFGFTVTTRPLGLFSSASLLTTISGTQVSEGGAPPEDTLISDYQQDLSATFHSPPSLAVGGSWQVRSSSTLHVTAEYFGKIDSYTVVQGAPFTGQTTGQELQRQLVGASRAVLNWGIGFEEELSAGVSLYGGFWVDRSTNEDSVDSGLSVTNYDLRHVTAGSNFQWRALRFTLGVSYAWGQGPVQQIIDFGGIGGGGEVIRDADATYQRIKGIVGLSFEV